jgi:hypothetical protein
MTFILENEGKLVCCFRRFGICRGDRFDQFASRLEAGERFRDMVGFGIHHTDTAEAYAKVVPRCRVIRIGCNHLPRHSNCLGGVNSRPLRAIEIDRPWDSELAVLALFTLAAFSSQALSANDLALPASAMADKVIVLKGERKLLLIKSNEVLKTYTVSLGGNPVGLKIRQGDHKTPEGNYALDRHNARSQYYKSIHISYPNADDVARARKLGVPTGGDLFIHGLPNDFKGPSGLGDWTDGCIAVTNAEIDEIWRVVADGTPIEIRP